MTDLVEKADSREFIAEILGFLDTKKGKSSRIMEETHGKYLLQYILTDREVEIFEKLLRGESEKDIALDYMISVNTVKAHVRNIYKKLNIHNRREAHQWLYGLDGRETGTGVDL
jgi:DNA-binding NarL/FixJ family response regulator